MGSVRPRFFDQVGHETMYASCGNKSVDQIDKVIYTKSSKHYPCTVAYTIDCVCSKMLNHGLNHGLFLSLFKLIPCPIHIELYMC